MKYRLYLSLLTVFFASLYLTGCAGKAGKMMDSAQASYQANDYESALRDSVNALREKPNYERAQNFVTTFFNAAVDARKSSIKSLETSPDKFRWDQIVVDYKALIQINTSVKNLPPLIHKKTKQRITFNTQDYSNELNKASEQAAEAHYQEGLQIAASGSDVETQKRAAKEFKRVEEFVRGYKDVVSQYAKARSAGVKKMAILTFEDKSGKARRYGSLDEIITDEIMSAVLNDSSAIEFLEIISRDQLEQIMAEQNLGFTGRFDENTVAGIGNVEGVHELVVGQITAIIYTPPRRNKENWVSDATIRVKTGTERYVDKNGKTQTRDKYSDRKISANVIHHKVESSVKIVGSYKIIDVKTGQLKGSQNFDKLHEFKADWARFTGDKGALSRNDKILAAKKEQAPPVEDQMALDAAKILATELADNLKEYAR